MKVPSCYWAATEWIVVVFIFISMDWITEEINTKSLYKISRKSTINEIIALLHVKNYFNQDISPKNIS